MIEGLITDIYQRKPDHNIISNRKLWLQSWPSRPKSHPLTQEVNGQSSQLLEQFNFVIVFLLFHIDNSVFKQIIWTNNDYIYWPIHSEWVNKFKCQFDAALLFVCLSFRAKVNKCFKFKLYCGIWLFLTIKGFSYHEVISS